MLVPFTRRRQTRHSTGAALQAERR
jgi:hypothetical protein